MAEREGFYTAVLKFPTRMAKSLLLNDRVIAVGDRISLGAFSCGAVATPSNGYENVVFASDTNAARKNRATIIVSMECFWLPRV